MQHTYVHTFNKSPNFPYTQIDRPRTKSERQQNSYTHAHSKFDIYTHSYVNTAWKHKLEFRSFYKINK